MESVHRFTVLGLALSAIIISSGCAGATRLPMRTRGPAGEALPAKQLDLAFLDADGTQREEVVRRLSSVDTAYSNPRLFWGRWSDSKWGYWWLVASPSSAAGDAKRVWHVHNLLLSFDEHGVMQKKKLFSEDRSLWLELHARLADAPPLDLTQPLAIKALGPGRLQTITLGKDSIQFDRLKAKITHLEMSPQAICRISHDWVSPANPGVTCHTFYLAEKSLAGKKISFCASPADIAATFQYLQQYGTPLLRWD